MDNSYTNTFAEMKKRKSEIKKEKRKEFDKLNRDKDMDLSLEKYFASQLGYEDIKDFYSEIENENGTTNRTYRISNENLKELFKHLKLKNKRVATVGSSGDQLIMSLMSGAKEVDLIDLNISAKHFIELKLAAIRALNFEEFKKFMEVFPDCMVAQENFWIYRKISHLLPRETQQFWDTIILSEGYTELLFEMYHNTGNLKGKFNWLPFLSDETEYEKCQEVLNNGDYKINYIFGELKDFPKKLNGKYDLILLSNILDYYDINIYDRGYDDTPKHFLDVVKKLYQNNLNVDGQIQLTSNAGVIDKFIKEDEMNKFVKKLKASSKIIKKSGIFDNDSYMLIKPNLIDIMEK